jgi:CelD/BcsL family acetyltransferase involved in cellulose biosynthesis
MRISLIHPKELSTNEISAWHSMQRNTRSLANPFLCPDFAFGVGQFRSNARVAVLAEGSGIVGFFPFERRQLGIGVPIGAELNNCQGLIHAPALEWEPREVLRACKISAWKFDNLVPGQRPFDCYAMAAVPSAVIDLTAGLPMYQEKQRMKSPQFYKELDRNMRKLQRDSGEIRLVTDSHDISALRLFMRWKSDQCLRNRWVDIFDRPWIVDLIDYLFNTRNDSFSAWFSLLYAGETPVAGQFGLRSGDCFSCWFTAYDTQFASYSPGLIQVLPLVEKLAAAGVQTIDLGDPAPFKDKLKSHDISFTRGMVTRGPFAAVAHRMRDVSADWARHEIRRCPPLYRAADRLLRCFGRIA